jgi:hypothetical protein
VDQSIDLGHYRKVLVVVPGLYGDEATAAAHRLKVYLPKSADAKEGEPIALYPTRYLVYSDRGQPTEVRNQLNRNPDASRRDDLASVTLTTEQLANSG